MKYLLDTGPWVNAALTPEVLPERIKKLLDEPQPKAICSVSLLECAILYRRGRLQIKTTLPDFLKQGIVSEIEILELTPQIAAATNDLPENFHGDPFDRVIVATAKVMNLTLVTCGTAIRDAKCCKLEFYPFKPSRKAK